MIASIITRIGGDLALGLGDQKIISLANPEIFYPNNLTMLTDGKWKNQHYLEKQAFL